MLRIRKYINKRGKWPIVSIALIMAVVATMAVAVPTIAGGYDLLTEGSWVGPINGAYFESFTPKLATGSGRYDSFLRIQHNTSERGYNTDGDLQSPPFDTKSGTFTHSIQLGDIPIVVNPVLGAYDTEPGTVIPGAFYELRCDTNESGPGTGPYLTLKRLEIWMADAPGGATITGYVDDNAAAGYPPSTGFPSGATKVWSLDNGGNNWINMNYDLNPGSGGQDNLYIVPASLFSGWDDTDYFILFAEFGKEVGYEGVTYATSAGFEEWGVVYPPCGEVSITKTASPSTLGCPGETITYTLTVSNAGPETATGIYLEDTLPTNMALTGVKLNGSSTSDYSIISGVLRYPASGGVSLDDGQSFILTIEGTATDCNPLANNVTVYADNDCSTAGNTANTNTNRNIPPIVSNLITNDGIGSCESQSAVNAAYAAWHGALSFSGGCNRSDDITIPAAPDHCGGQATVTWNITSDCENPIVGSATFTVAAAPALNVTCPDDYVGAYGVSCSTDPEITGSPTVSGGCDPQVTYQDDIVPGDTCGWTVTRTWNITDLCESYNCTQYISCTCPACETACAAQASPGQTRFPGASSWFTYIIYNKGEGTSGTPKEYPIFAGQTQRVGTLYVYNTGDTLYVKYSNTGAEPGCSVYFNAYHLQVDDEYDDFRSTILFRRNPVPGQCEYGGSLSNVPETGWIAADISGYGDNDVYIFAHSIACYYCDS